jgi:hypothetical protein
MTPAPGSKTPIKWNYSHVGALSSAERLGMEEAILDSWSLHHSSSSSMRETASLVKWK